MLRKVSFKALRALPSTTTFTALQLRPQLFQTAGTGSAVFRQLMCRNFSIMADPSQRSIRVPRNVSLAQLGEIIKIDPQELFQQVSQVTNELVADKFQIVSTEAIEMLCIQNDIDIEVENIPESNPNWKRRAPIVTIMGHVDHGKTTLLDAFRHSTKVDEEFGDITQSIGAFSIVTDSNHEITFIDTPGHEAFHNLRERGALVTDMIILVVSGMEGIQPQTVEVIELIKQHQIPVVVAINKMDRLGADAEPIINDLLEHGLISVQHGGDVHCIPISAKEKTNLNTLEETLIKVANEKVELREDFSSFAQCVVIESNMDTKSQHISATVVVKKGTLRQEDIIVCGEHECRVRSMVNDQGKQVKEAFPGQAVQLTGFKAFPDVGTSLYACKSLNEAGIISNYYKKLHNDLRTINADNSLSEKIHDLKKSVGKLSRLEKRMVYGGDKQIMYHKLGLINKEDLEIYRKKLGLRKDLNYDDPTVKQLVEENIEEIERMTGPKKISRLQNAKSSYKKEEFLKMIEDYQKQQQMTKTMDEEELKEFKEHQQQMKEVFRTDEISYYPIIIKGPSAGVLETLMSETDKLLSGNSRVYVINSQVGPITEADISMAMSSGGVIFSFDVGCNPMAQRKASDAKVVVRQHKLIYKFMEDLENYLNDAEIEIGKEGGENIRYEVVGSASVQEIHKIKGIKYPALGSKVYQGTLDKKGLFRIMRDGDMIARRLKMTSLKKVQTDVGQVSRGEECGIILEYPGQIQVGDIIEAYNEKEFGEKKFNHKHGVTQSY